MTIKILGISDLHHICGKSFLNELNSETLKISLEKNLPPGREVGIFFATKSGKNGKAMPQNHVGCDWVIYPECYDKGNVLARCFEVRINAYLRAVASLTVPGGQEFHFPHFSSNFDQLFLFFLNHYLFFSSFWPSGWATRPPKKALATPLAYLMLVPEYWRPIKVEVLFSVHELALKHSTSLFYQKQKRITSRLILWLEWLFDKEWR